MWGVTVWYHPGDDALVIWYANIQFKGLSILEFDHIKVMADRGDLIRNGYKILGSL